FTKIKTPSNSEPSRDHSISPDFNRAAITLETWIIRLASSLSFSLSCHARIPCGFSPPPPTYNSHVAISYTIQPELRIRQVVKCADTIARFTFIGLKKPFSCSDPMTDFIQPVYNELDFIFESFLVFFKKIIEHRLLRTT